MLKQVAEGVLVHESEFIQSNSVVVQGRDGVLIIDPGITSDEMAALANDLRELGQPVVAGFQRILIGITSSGTRISATRPGTVQPAARLPSTICCRTRTGRTA